ncbi:MAG: hypothetical protein K6T34_04700 [Thermoflavifilum sp.]|nr:hypothetical protein [Thermoflavifilum sp.]
MAKPCKHFCVPAGNMFFGVKDAAMYGSIAPCPTPQRFDGPSIFLLR